MLSLSSFLGLLAHSVRVFQFYEIGRQFAARMAAARHETLTNLQYGCRGACLGSARYRMIPGSAADDKSYYNYCPINGRVHRGLNRRSWAVDHRRWLDICRPHLFQVG